MKRWQIVYTVFCLACLGQLHAQTKFKGQLINKTDGVPLPYAYIRLADIDKFQVTDSIGKFVFIIPDTLKALRFEISDIGLHTAITYTPTGAGVEKVYLERKSITISNVEIVGLSAKQVVQKAISEVPHLYADKSYVSHSFYRQVHKENGKFVKLIELQAATMFRLTLGKKSIGCKEAFAIKAFRRSIDYEVNRLQHLDHFFDLLAENPVYHMVGTVLNAAAIDVFKFKFDTVASNNDNYVVNFWSTDYTKESVPNGKLTIDRNSFAIKKIERTNVKNTNADYRQVLSSDYVGDYVSGTFSAEYEPIDGKWYLKKLLREYTSEIFYRKTGNKMNSCTETFEWYSDSISDRVSADLVNEFSDVSNLYSCKYKYNPEAWAIPLRPFVFFKEEEVYNSLNKRMDIQEQFIKAGE